MSLEGADGSPQRRKVSLQSVNRFECDARSCCGFGDDVWVAELRGGIGVRDAQSGQLLARIPMENADKRPQFRCMALVHEEIWAGCTAGIVHIFDAPRRQWKSSLSIVGVEAAAPITSIIFDGRSVLGGSETGRVVQWNPFTKRQMMVFVALAPVTAVTVFASFVVSGDREGAVQLWDTGSGEMIVDHTGDASGVTSLLGEPATATLWVGRRNGSISVYAFAATAAAETKTEGAPATGRGVMSFVARLSAGGGGGGGAVTSMLSVSGKVLVTTYDRALIVFSSTTREVLSRVAGAHEAFIHGATRVYVAETVRAWTIGNDGAVRVWDIPGYYVPCQLAPQIGPREQMAIVNTVKSALSLENAHLSSCVAASHVRVADVKEELRLARDEVHELRLRCSSFERTLQERDTQIAAHDARARELEEKIKKLHKELADANALVDAARRESTMLRADYNAAQMDVSQAQRQASTERAERAVLEQKLSAQSTDKSQVEIRLSDREAEVMQLKAENARLQGCLAQLTSSQGAERDSYRLEQAKNEGILRQELDELRKRSQLLSSLLVSMEYTIRRKEEEERDMTALLNALRRKAAGSVSDAHLDALLKLTLVRNPSRFDMECDEHTKALLRDRNGPFVRFLQRLRDTDANTYGNLLEYLQHPNVGSEFSGIFSQLMALVEKEGGAGESDIVSFKKSLPVVLNSLNLMSGAPTAQTKSESKDGAGGVQLPGLLALKAGMPPSHSPPPPPPPISSSSAPPLHAAAPLQFNGTAATSTLNTAAAAHLAPQALSSAGISDFVATAAAQLAGKPTSAPGCDLSAQLQGVKFSEGRADALKRHASGLPEDVYVKQLRSTFEFILQTRHGLVEQLGVLHRRVTKARQVLDALTRNARDGPFSASRSVSSASAGGAGGRHGVGSTATQILEELHRLVSVIVASHLTAAEKQRLGVEIWVPEGSGMAMGGGVVTEEQQSYEVLIDGRLYDCRNFKHPGGGIIKFFCGSGDATEAFQQSHMRSPRASRWLQLLPNRPAPERLNKDVMEAARLKKLSHDFRKLHAEFLEEGMFDCCYSHALYRLLELVIMHVAGLWILLRTSYWIPACILLGIAEGRCGWVQHECGHMSLFGVPWLDRRVQEVCYGLGNGMSAAWWRSQHNKHHMAPQKLRHDTDLDTLPLVAFNRAVVRMARNNALMRIWVSFQTYFFVPFTCSLVALFWQIFLHPRHMIRTRRYAEMVSVLCRLLFIAAICHSMQLTAFQGICGYFFHQFFGAVYIFVNFTLSHSHLDVLPANKHVHWVEYASNYTINISPSWLTNWWMGYLNFQIEHHLFPTMPQFRFAKLYPRVRSMMQKHNLPYDCRTYSEALVATFKNLHHVSGVFNDPPTDGKTC